ncbi:ABC transporter permease [Clostridium aciditolerans]|uniref:ABC transporter permease subunit n=1 Tax=Clostridium aciditolerans TaxID=339861 RepID=A0A934M2A3_9CLOT|nr:ABC transporter permease subunit [Clostridium aciditolerans]MBI6874199.1 ABC transporter permease subunit [Clostridium aciditolerans]
MKKKSWLHYVIIGLLILYLVTPIIATFAYSIATEWYKTILPPAYTLNWYKSLFSDTRFWYAMGRSLFVSIVPIIISLIAILLALFVITVYLPKYEKILQTIVLLPYVIPGVVLSIALIKLYFNTLGNSVWMLIFAYSVFILPFMYQGIRNSLRNINVKQLVEACELLGATKIQAFTKVVVANILPGIKVSILLSFSTLFGEFALVNLLIGGRYETIQIMLYKMLRESGHIASALVTTYFIIVLVISYIALNLSKSIEVKKVQK